MENEILEGKKLRYSRQREIIFKYLKGSLAHPSAETVYKDLKGEIQGLSLGTVYRNLKLLEQLGKIKCVGVFDGVERYDARINEHSHFLCRSCNELFDLDKTDFNMIRQAVCLDKGFRVSGIEVIVSGACPHCKTKE